MLMVEKLGIINIKQFCEDVCKIVGIDEEKPECTQEDILQLPEKTLSKIREEAETKRSSVINVDKSEPICPVKVVPTKKNKTYKVQIDKDADDSDRITMKNRKANPVKVVPTSKKSRVNVAKTDKKSKTDENLNKFIDRLKASNINFSSIKRMPTGLVEVVLNQPNGNNVTISVDIDNKIYNSGYMIFFIGKIAPLSEYSNKPIILNDKTLNAVINSKPIPVKYYVPEDLVKLNGVLNITTLKETNKDKKEKVLDKAFKAIEAMNEEIINVSAGHPVRFAFAKYKSEDEFSLVSSKRNLVSNLSKEKLNTDKEIWININGDSITLNYDPAK